MIAARWVSVKSIRIFQIEKNRSQSISNQDRIITMGNLFNKSSRNMILFLLLISEYNYKRIVSCNDCRRYLNHKFIQITFKTIHLDDTSRNFQVVQLWTLDYILSVKTVCLKFATSVELFSVMIHLKHNLYLTIR